MTDRRSTYEYLPDVAGDAHVRIINDLRRGKLDATGTVTIENGTTTTTITDLRLTERSVIMLIPRSSAAGTVNWWVSSKGRSKVVLGHADPGGARDFDFLALG